MFVSVRRLLVVCVSLGALGVFGTSVPAAGAASAWWQLGSGARPSYLHHGEGKLGQPQVQEIVSPLVEFEGSPQTAFGFTVGGVESGVFATEALAPVVEAKALTLANVRVALEAAYGAGTVEVSCEAPVSVAAAVGCDVGVANAVTFKVTTAGGSTPITSPLEGVGLTPGPEVKVISPGTPAVADGEIVATAENLGDANVEGGVSPVVIADKLPAGLKAVGISGWKTGPGAAAQKPVQLSCDLRALSCTVDEKLVPYEQVELRISVVVEEGAHSGELNEVVVSGGGTRGASFRQPVTINPAQTPFGVESYSLTGEEEGGGPSTQAGAHPFQLTTTLALNEGPEENPLDEKLKVFPAGSPKDTVFKWPAGLIGNPQATPTCPLGQFLTKVRTEENLCSPQTAVGVAVVTVDEPAIIGAATFTLPLFNLEPNKGEPARFGFNVLAGDAPVVIDTAVRTGGDYGITVSSNNITQTAGFLSAKVTVWGVPGDARHDSQRGWGCLYEAREATFEHVPCNALGESHPKPFLTSPTSCGGALQSTLEADSWTAPGAFTAPIVSSMPALAGCNRLPFSASISATPDGQAASTPTGLNVDVHVPQEVSENAEGLAGSNVRDITVQFPEGVVINPASADGLQACPESEVGLQPGLGEEGELLFSPVLPEPFCPDASKVGTVTIKTPLLPKGQNVEGALYLADPAPNGEGGQNPFNSLIATYIIAKDPTSGTLVKLPGSVSLDPNTGRITATFENNPQLAFEDAEIHLFGGERAPFATPAHCGTYTTNATFTPWSGTEPVSSQSSFQVTSGPNGSPCPPASLPFRPSLAAGTTNINAGAFSPLTTTITREDGNQNIGKVQLHMPPGLSGILSGIPLCGEAAANAGTCAQASLIGHTIVSVGLGGDPFSVTGGEVFLTEKIAGSPADAPFGLSIVNPAVAGPFNLGKVIVRATIEVDPHTAALTVTTTEIPHILDGIPLQIKHVNVTIDRAGFTFNPTNCAPQQVTGTIGSVEGASSPVAVPFQVTNCASLKFAPKFTVTTAGKNSKAGGATLTAKLSEPAGAQGTQANITRVKVDLPKQLPSRLTTLQKACTNTQFEANPANCPKESKIGYAKVTTPLLPVPLEGPAIFVSHGGEAFPSLTMVLQGYGVTIDLVGTTFISSKGITSTTFKTVPDVPFNAFQLTLPQGKFSALAANVPAKAHYSLCGQTLSMPTEFLAQNGAKINQTTKVSVTGCAKKKAAKKKHKSKQHKPAKGKH
jgi:hypothetical protein